MSVHLGYIDAYVSYRSAELRREAELDHLADLATANARPVRSVIAAALRAAADRLEGRPLHRPVEAIA